MKFISSILVIFIVSFTGCAHFRKKPSLPIPPPLSTQKLDNRINRIETSLGGAIQITSDGKTIVRTVEDRGRLIDYKASILEGLIK